MNNLTMQTELEFKFKNGMERIVLCDMYDEDRYGTEEEFFAFIEAWIQTGKAKIIPAKKSKEAEMADLIAQELMSVKKAKNIEQDRINKQNYNVGSHGYHEKVAFPAKSLLDAQEMQQILMKNFNISEDKLEVSMKGGSIQVIIEKCPIKTFNAIERSFGLKRATEFVSDSVDKTAKGIINTADMTINNLAVPVAKTAIGTSAKVGKSLFGFGAKLAGIAVGEITKATKQCVTEIKNDGYIAEAKGEVIDSLHAIKRTIGTSGFSGGGGVILE